MKPRRIGVVMGGSSAERAVSLCSGQAVLQALRAAGEDAQPIELGAARSDALLPLLETPVDVAFLALHGRLGEDGCVQGVLEWLGIPYTGSSVLASALAMDKLKAKELFRLHNVSTPPYYAVDGQSRARLAELHGAFGFPVIVKPRREGSSVGVTPASHFAELEHAVDQALCHDDHALVERRVVGQEVHVALLGERVLGAIEVETRSGLYDFESKYTPGATAYRLPARLAPARQQAVLTLASRAARALETAGAVRVDLIVTPGQHEYVLEVNTLPGMTPTSLLPKIAASAGFEFTDLCLAMLNDARLHTAGRPLAQVMQLPVSGSAQVEAAHGVAPRPQRARTS